MLAVSFFTIGLLSSMLYVWMRPALPDQSRVVVEGRVLSVPKEYQDCRTAVIKAYNTQYSVDDKEVKDTEEPLYFALYYTTPLAISIGDDIQVYAEFHRTDRTRLCGELVASRVVLSKNRFNNVFVRFSRKCSDGLDSYIKSHYSGQTAALLSAVLTGNQQDLSKETKDAFRKAGLTHLVAVSGMNISILLFLFTVLAFFIPRWWRLLISLPLLLFLVIFTGGSPSIIRAAIMSSAFLLADIQGRESDGLTNLFVAVGALLIFDYDMLYDISFLLSFSAVLGLLLGMPLLTHSFFECWYGKVLAATVMAQLGAIPISVAVFGTMYPYALLANLITVPLFTAIVALSLGVIGLTAVIPPLGQLVLPMSGNAIALYLKVAKTVSILPAAEVRLGEASVGVGVFLACALAAVYLLLLLNKNKSV